MTGELPADVPPDVPAADASAEPSGEEPVEAPTPPLGPSDDRTLVRAGLRGFLDLTRSVLPVVIVVACYCVLAVLAYWPVSPLDSSHIGGGTGSDSIQLAWFLTWTPFALSHGNNPFFTNYLDYPSGANLATNPLMLPLGLLSWPVALAFGPVATFNLLMRLAIASSATSMCLVLRSWTRWWPAAFLGGLLYGFGSSYISSEAGGNLALAFVPIPPLLLWCLSELFVTQRRSPARVGLLLGLLCTAQILTNSEVFADCIVLGIVGVLALAIWHRSEVVSRARKAAPGIAIAAVSFAVLSAYPIWFLVAGPRHVTGSILPLWFYSQEHTDLLGLIQKNIVVPLTLANGAPYLSSLGNVVTFVDHEAYLGLPLTVVTLVFLFVWRRVGIIRLAGGMALAVFVLSLGPHLNVDGVKTGVPLPGILLTYLPLLDNIVWNRYALEVSLFVSIVFAVGLDRLATHWQVVPVEPVQPQQERPAPSRAPTTPVAASRVRASVTSSERATSSTRSLGTERLLRSLLPSVLCLGVAAVSLYPLISAYPIATQQVAGPSQLVSSLRQSVPSGGVVLAFPYGTGSTAAPMAWQAIDQMQFRLVGGYAVVPAAPGVGTPMWGGRYSVTPPYALKIVDLAVAMGSAGGLGSTMSSAIETAEYTCNVLPGVLREFAVDAVVVWPTGPDPSLLERLLQPVLGMPSRSFTQALVWYDVPHDLERQAGCSTDDIRKLIGPADVTVPDFSLSEWTVPAGDRTIVTTTAAPYEGTAPVFTAISGRSFDTFAQINYQTPQDWLNQPNIYLMYKGTGSGNVYQVVFTFGPRTPKAIYTIMDDSAGWTLVTLSTTRPGIPSSDWSHVFSVRVALPSKSETGTIALGVPVYSLPLYLGL